MALLKDTLIQHDLISPDSTRTDATEAAHALARDVADLCKATGVNPRQHRSLVTVVKKLKSDKDYVICFYKVLSHAYDLAHQALTEVAKSGDTCKAKEVLEFLEEIQKGETS